MKKKRKVFNSPFFIRLRHWEFWNSKIVYAPLYPYWLWLSIKARSFYFLTAANPTIANGGFVMERKKDVNSLLPGDSHPFTLYFETGTPFNEISERIQHTSLKFPVIAKPDYGERGIAVKKIETETELREYAAHMPVSFLVQQFIPYENEVGIFYYRIPGEPKGHISGIVNKEPVAITGDGIHSVEELVYMNERYILQIDQIRQLHPDKLDTILSIGERLVLVPYGNHARGSKFTDISHRISDKLTETIDQICTRIDGFFFGRLDIRFNTWEELEEGKNISIIELNGSGSEPTHIYDPKHSILFAWKEIIRHWNIMYRIAVLNNEKGVAYLSFKNAQKVVSEHRRITSMLSARTW